jgi:hypothetical protein
MSTRAQIAVRDGSSTQLLYQHSDGYPEGVLPTLKQYIQGVRDGGIRDNVSQSVGWLIVWGHKELYADLGELGEKQSIMDWKASYIEPSPEGLHGDIEYLYVVDLVTRTVMYTEKIDEILDLQYRLFGHPADPGILIPVLLELPSLWKPSGI